MAALILPLQDWMTQRPSLFSTHRDRVFDSTKKETNKKENARLGRFLCWHTHSISNISMKYWTSRTGSRHLQQWMWTRLQLQQPSDFDHVMCTAPCRRVRAIAWVAFVVRPSTPQLQKPPGCWERHILSIDTDTTKFSCCFHAYLSGQRGAVRAGSRCFLSVFVGFYLCFYWRTYSVQGI